MRHLLRRSLLVQLLSVYLLFVIVVLVGGTGIDLAIEQRLSHDVEASDQALAQEIALSISLQLGDDEQSLARLSAILANTHEPEEIASEMATFRASRSDTAYLYWLDPVGALLTTAPTNKRILGSEFSPPDVIQQILFANNAKPVFEAGLAVEATYQPGVIIAQAVFAPNGTRIGILAASISLDELSKPLVNIVQAQRKQGRHLLLSAIDSQGALVATGDNERVLQRMLDELPGADQALKGNPVSQLGPGTDGQQWLFSSAPVPSTGWAVVVQRPASEALAVISQFHLWLLAAALLFTLGGLLFWLLLLGRVIRPLHNLALQHQALPVSEQAIPTDARVLARRADEVGNLASSLIRLEHDGLEKLSELRTLLETSNTIVGSLDPHAVVSKIIQEVRRLVDVQAAAVLLPDEQKVLRVLASAGHSARYEDKLSLVPENMSSSAVLALRERKPIQKLLTPHQTSPSLSYDEGFRAVLAIPIISRHAGSVVLLVHRIEPRPFDQNEVDLLLTFANYATLAWEHAVLYERSDERLREIAQENKQLYQQAAEEKQRLEAIMSSMSDGLVLTGIDGVVLYANLGARALARLPGEAFVRRPISTLYEALLAEAVDPEKCAQTLARAEAAETTELVVEIRSEGKRRVIHLRLFDVKDEPDRAIGRGLLLRDITREREMDEFKTTLLAAVGHELRTPLAAIKGHASTLLQQDVIWSQEDERHFLQTISGEADRLAQLVSNLLDLSRQEAGLLLLNRSPARVSDLVAKIVERFSKQGNRIEIDLPVDLSLVDIDSARIEVVLHNLLANALTYSASGVRISAVHQDEQIILAVTDSGPGIEPDELPHVFERFYQARQGRQRRSGGTGLGLAICKAFIEAHGGTIWARSSEQGTTIAFSLPTVPPTEEGTSGGLTAITSPLQQERMST